MAAQTSPVKATRETVLIDYVALWLADSRITACTRFGGRTPSRTGWVGSATRRVPILVCLLPGPYPQRGRVGRYDSAAR